MYYRIQPPFSISWTDMPNDLIRTFIDQGRDLDLLEWRPVEEQHGTQSVLSIAVRYGVKTGSGLAFAAHHLITVKRPSILASSFADLEASNRSAQNQAAEDLMERQFPGWKEQSETLNDSIADSMKESIQKAQAEAQQILSAPVNEDLHSWWVGRGGLPVV